MTKRRKGNPKWGQINIWSAVPIQWPPSAWEVFLQREGIAEGDVMKILDRKHGRPEETVIARWVMTNHHNRFVPSRVLNELGLKWRGE